jgi:peptide/nickel transport system substrate-binding protein
MLLFGNIVRHNPDLFSFWHSAERFHPGLNLSLYESRTADALLESIRREFNPETRTTLLRDLENLIAKDRPAIFLFSPNYLYVHPKRLGGVSDAPIGEPADRFRDVERWFLKTTRVFP